MRIHGLLLGAVALLIGAGTVAEAGPSRHHRRHLHYSAYRTTTYVERTGVYAGTPLPPLAGTVGTPIPPEAAHFMGYPYDVPGYRYAGYDACLLRVGGVFGPGPSAGRCPFGLDRAF